MLLPRLRRFGAALSGSNDEGDDIAHAAIERALSKSGQWQPGTRLDSWMFKIMQNIWKDRRRAFWFAATSPKTNGASRPSPGYHPWSIGKPISQPAGFPTIP